MIDESLKEVFERRISNKKGPLSFVRLPDSTVVSYYLMPLEDFFLVKRFITALNVTDEELAKIIYEKYVIKEYQVFDADMAPAGFIIKIATQILNDSNPYKDLEERVMSERASYEDALDPLEDIKFTIITAFPAYKIEELDSYDIDMLIKLLTRAEHYLSKRTPGFNKISFVSANAPPRKPIIDIDAENRALRDAY